jgi:hypothetical protein
MVGRLSSDFFQYSGEGRGLPGMLFDLMPVGLLGLPFDLRPAGHPIAGPLLDEWCDVQADNHNRDEGQQSGDGPSSQRPSLCGDNERNW